MLSTRIFALNSTRISPQLLMAATNRTQFYAVTVNHDDNIVKSSNSFIHTQFNYHNYILGNNNLKKLLGKTNGLSSSKILNQYTRQNSNLPKSPKLPDAAQIQKYAFLTIGFLWDTTKYIYIFMMKLILKYVINNPKVQYYWELLHKKIADARRKN